MKSQSWRKSCPTAEALLRELKEPSLVEHSRAVASLALEIAERVDFPVDRELVYRGAMLHDIGRCVSHGLDHISEGVKLARLMKLDERLVNIIARHIGAGLTREEAASLGLPPGDYLPRTPEEKIVAYSDNLVLGKERVSFEESLRRFGEELGESHSAVERMKRLHREISSWLE